MAWKPPYAQLAQMRDWLRIREIADTDDDALLKLKISAASRGVDGSCHRQFGKEDLPVARTYRPRWSRTFGCHVAEIDDIMDLTDFAFTLDGTALTADQYELQPDNAVEDGRPYTYVKLNVGTVSAAFGMGKLIGLGLWGWNATPDEVTEASMLQASRLNIRRDSPYGIAGGADGGGELRLLARLDPDVVPLVSALVRTGWVAR